MLDDLIKERRKKLDAIREAGIEPYPARIARSFDIAKALEDFDTLEKSQKEISLAGRLMSVRDQGKIIFADIADESGKIQIVLKGDSMPQFALWQSTLDIGDFVSVTGPLFRTKKGEMSVDARGLQMATKSLLPLPDKWEGLENEDIRLRERYVDLIMNPEVREMFRKKSVFWQSTREFLLKEKFMEVETSVLEPMAGGAEAEPFRTHHNALDTDFTLRISLELQLKKLIAGGFEKIFEIGRVFRNEGIDRDHLQDFTFMECYWAYNDYRAMMSLTETMYKFVIERTMGTLKTTYQGHDIDWSGEWPEVDYVEAFKKENVFDPTEVSREELLKKAKDLNLAPEKGLERGRLIDLIYKKTVRPKLIQPCFLINQPVLISPLSKASPENPNITERFQIVAGGTELGNGYSELNDPIDQRHRFEEQMKLKEGGDNEAMSLDEDFLKALEYGMPPTTGFGMSERVFAVLMDKPIRETVFFPLMRPKDKREKTSKSTGQDFSKKMTIIVREDVESWQLANTIAHIAAYLGNKMKEPFDTGDYFPSKDNVNFPRNSQYPIVALRAAKAEMMRLAGSLKDSSLPWIAYTQEMIDFIDDKKLEKAFKAKESQDMDILGLGIFGTKDDLKELTGDFDLLK